jgi:hypothetical protein
MAGNDERRTVTVEVDLSDSSEGPDGVYQSVIQVRITSTEKQACDAVKEAIELAIQIALDDRDETDAVDEPRH